MNTGSPRGEDAGRAVADMTVAAKDPGKGHFWVSMISSCKSYLDMFSCFASAPLGFNTSVQSLSHHGPGPGGAVHGSGTPADQGKDELRRFFREVDKRVEDRHSKPTGRPLILAAVDYYHPLFREVSKNPRLLDKGIVHDPKSMSADELRLAALEIVGPLREEGIAEALDEYGRARAHAQGSDDVHAVGSAAAAGRVKHLFLEEARRIWGRVDRISPEAPVPVVDWPRPSGSERARPSATGDGTRPGPASSARAAPVR